MNGKHLPASLAYLLLLFVSCLPSYGDDARQPSGDLATIAPEQTSEILPGARQLVRDSRRNAQDRGRLFSG